jgi:hypothetical protein
MIHQHCNTSIHPFVILKMDANDIYQEPWVRKRERPWLTPSNALICGGLERFRWDKNSHVQRNLCPFCGRESELKLQELPAIVQRPLSHLDTCT